MSSAASILIHPELLVIERALDGYAAQWHHLRFLVSEQVEKDGHRWRHCSVSRSDRTLPTYDDLCQLKRLCVGEHNLAIQVFPPADEHTSIGTALGVEVLHLWQCLDGRPIPDFRHEETGWI